MAFRQRTREKPPGLFRIAGDDLRYDRFGRDRPAEDLDSFLIGKRDQRPFPLPIKTIEEKKAERNLLPHRFDIFNPPEPPHGDLKRPGPSIRMERDRLSFESH